MMIITEVRATDIIWTKFNCIPTVFATETAVIEYLQKYYKKN